MTRELTKGILFGFLLILTGVFLAVGFIRGCQNKPQQLSQEIEIARDSFRTREKELIIKIVRLVSDSAIWQKTKDSMIEEINSVTYLYNLGLRQAAETNKELDKLAELVKKEEGKNDTNCIELSIKAADLSLKWAAQKMYTDKILKAQDEMNRINDSIIDVERNWRQELETSNDYSRRAYQELYGQMKKIKPRNAVYVGGVVQGGKEQWITGIGPGASLVNKNGRLYTLNVLFQPTNRWQPLYQIETKFKLSFR